MRIIHRNSVQNTMNFFLTTNGNRITAESIYFALFHREEIKEKCSDDFEDNEIIHWDEEDLIKPTGWVDQDESECKNSYGGIKDIFFMSADESDEWSETIYRDPRTNNPVKHLSTTMHLMQILSGTINLN